jgi:hypothetical protein
MPPIQTPLTALDARFVWISVHQLAFESLQDALCDSVELALPDLNAQFVITTDASQSGWAAVLEQA